MKALNTQIGVNNIALLSAIFIVPFLYLFLPISARASEGVVLKMNIESTQCFNGMDDDGDGLMDYPDDLGCESQIDTSEISFVISCGPLVTSAHVGDEVSWIATVSGSENNSYSYIWSDVGLSGDSSVLVTSYSTAGTKTVSLTVHSASMSITQSCGSVTVTTQNTNQNPNPGNRSPTGGPSGPTAPLTPPQIPLLDSAPEKEINRDDISTYAQNFSRQCLDDAPRQTFQDFKDDLLCEGLITKQKEDKKYNYTQNITRKELVAIAYKIRRVDPIKPEQYAHYYTDVGLPGESPWIEPMVETSLAIGLLTDLSMTFRPHEVVTRAETFDVLMRSVCYPRNDIDNLSWQSNVYDAAKSGKFTNRTWANFGPDSPVLRQEVFVITSRILDWANETGGCGNSQYMITPEKNISPQRLSIESTKIQKSDVPEKVSIQINEDTSQQLPGTFALLYENQYEKIFSYIIRSGGTPDGIRAQYLQHYGFSKKYARKISIHDLSGQEHDEKTWFVAHELVFVYIAK